MENQYELCESKQSRKQIFFRRAAMLFVFGLFFWQIAGISQGAGAFAVSASDAGNTSNVSSSCERSDFSYGVRDFVQFFSAGDIAVFENALLFGQAPCR